MNLQKDSQRFLQNNLQNNSYSKIETDLHVLKTRKTRVLKAFKKLIESLEKGKLSLNYKEKLIKAIPADLARIISESPQNDSFDLSIRNIMLNGIMSSENISPGSGPSYIKHLINDPTFVIKEGCLRSEIQNIKQVVKENIGRGLCYQVVNKIIDIGGIHSTFEFVISRDSKFSIVVSPSFLITGDFHELFSVKREKIKSSSVIFVDGIIETTREIDKILLDFAQCKKNLVIFARGFAPDVANTFNQNFLEKRLNIYPFVLKEKDDFFSNVSNEFIKIDKDSSCLMNTIGMIELEKFYDLNIETHSARILNVESFERHIKINVPHHCKDVIGVIEDRVKLGIYAARESAKYGYLITSLNKTISKRGYEVGKRCAKSSLDLIENLGCIILQER